MIQLFGFKHPKFDQNYKAIIKTHDDGARSCKN
jgi:hypothetical protein